MIPLQLQVKNFVSYGSKIQTINFEPYNLICLSGKNGHGKSALLDALTWAIWGQARKISGVAKADDGLLRLGQTNMMVCLDFLFNNTKYRVKREYTATSYKSYTHLEFGIIDSNTEKFNPLTDKTIKATQEKILQTIGLDYESFVNSAFLRQGQSNEFSKKSSKDRKEILASILGLDKFERLRKRAQEKVKEYQTQKEYLMHVIEQSAEEIEKKYEISQELKAIVELLDSINKQENYYKNLQDELVKQKNFLSDEKNKIQRINFEKNQIENAIENFTNNFLSEVQQWRNIHKQSKRLKQFKNIEQLQESIETELALQKSLAEKRILLKEQIILKKEQVNSYLEDLISSYNQEVQELKFKIQETFYQIQLKQEKLKEYKEKLSIGQERIKHLANNLDNLLTETKKINEVERTLNNQEIQFNKRKEYYQKFVIYKNWLDNELLNIKHKKSLVQCEQNAQCPLCNQELDQEYKLSLGQALTKRELFYNHRAQRIEKIVPKLKKLIIEQLEKIESLKNQIKNILILQAQKIDIENKISDLNDEIETTLKNIKQVEKEIVILNELQVMLEKEIKQLQIDNQNKIYNDEQYKKLIKDIDSLNIELQKIEYNEQKEQNLIEQLNNLNKEKEELKWLTKDFALQEQRKENIALLNKKIKELKKQKIEKEKELIQYNDFYQKEKNILKSEEELNIKYKLILEQKEQIIFKKGSLEQQIKTLEDREKKFLEQKKIVLELEKNIEEYKAIAQVLSKDGIQALLIEDALPEIESEANNLLSRLTDNQAHLTIESLRDLKSGGTKETLDIKISDSVGVRPYELFSGGEAFRIDFALRISISKLLARRAGTALQTLIIDEGFGSQDEEGLTNIMQAIYKIQEDFSKVVIVSHLQSMKDQFPVNFHIYKGPEGSCIKIIEQG